MLSQFFVQNAAFIAGLIVCLGLTFVGVRLAQRRENGLSREVILRSCFAAAAAVLEWLVYPVLASLGYVAGLRWIEISIDIGMVLVADLIGVAVAGRIIHRLPTKTTVSVALAMWAANLLLRSLESTLAVKGLPGHLFLSFLLPLLAALMVGLWELETIEGYLVDRQGKLVVNVARWRYWVLRIGLAGTAAAFGRWAALILILARDTTPFDYRLTTRIAYVVPTIVALLLSILWSRMFKVSSANARILAILGWLFLVLSLARVRWWVAYPDRLLSEMGFLYLVPVLMALCALGWRGWGSRMVGAMREKWTKDTAIPRMTRLAVSTAVAVLVFPVILVAANALLSHDGPTITLAFVLAVVGWMALAPAAAVSMTRRMEPLTRDFSPMAFGVATFVLAPICLSLAMSLHISDPAIPILLYFSALLGGYYVTTYWKRYQVQEHCPDH